MVINLTNHKLLLLLPAVQGKITVRKTPLDLEYTELENELLKAIIGE